MEVRGGVGVEQGRVGPGEGGGQVGFGGRDWVGRGRVG